MQRSARTVLIPGFFRYRSRTDRRYLRKRDNPWELLAIAALFFLGVILLFQTDSIIVVPHVGRGAMHAARIGINYE